MVHRLIKIAEVLAETNDFSASTVQRKSTPSRILENKWYSSRVKYSQGKIRFYTTLEKRPGFETYLTLKQPKTSTDNHKTTNKCFKLPIETGRYAQKTQMERISPCAVNG